MPLTPRQRAASDCALAACKGLGMYPHLKVGDPVHRETFRALLCRDVVVACDQECPLDPGDYGICLTQFREAFRSCLKKKGWKAYIRLQLLCAVWEGNVPWNWGDWCDKHAGYLQPLP